MLVLKKLPTVVLYLLATMPMVLAMQSQTIPDIWDNGLTAAENQQMKSIATREGTDLDKLKELAQKLPHVAEIIIAENKDALNRFEDYAKGIPSDAYLTKEETDKLEENRLRKEVYYLEQFLQSQK